MTRYLEPEYNPELSIEQHDRVFQYLGPDSYAIKVSKYDQDTSKTRATYPSVWGRHTTST